MRSYKQREEIPEIPIFQNNNQPTSIIKQNDQTPELNEEHSRTSQNLNNQKKTQYLSVKKIPCNCRTNPPKATKVESQARNNEETPIRESNPHWGKSSNTWWGGFDE